MSQFTFTTFDIRKRNLIAEMTGLSFLLLKIRIQAMNLREEEDHFEEKRRLDEYLEKFCLRRSELVGMVRGLIIFRYNICLYTLDIRSQSVNGYAVY